MLIRRIPAFALAVALVAAMAGCESKKPEPSPSAPEQPTAPEKTTAQPAPSATEAPIQESLLQPEKLNEKAPDTFKAKFTTTKGDFVIQVHRDWAPNGADRFYNLVKNGYFQDVAFFRAIEGFMVQFGIHGSPKVNAAWRQARIPDDPVKQSNKPGYVTFATSGKDSRTVQLFINYADNARLDQMDFAPVGQVVEGMDVVNSLYKGYGEGAPGGRGPHQGRLQMEGNDYLRKEFPKLDYIKTASIVK